MEVARTDAGKESFGLFETDLDGAFRSWRDLYYTRARCGTNRNLWSVTNTMARIADSVYCEVERRSGQVSGALHDLFSDNKLHVLLQDIVGQDDFFDEYPVSSF